MRGYGDRFGSPIVGIAGLGNEAGVPLRRSLFRGYLHMYVCRTTERRRWPKRAESMGYGLSSCRELEYHR